MLWLIVTYSNGFGRVAAGFNKYLNPSGKFAGFAGGCLLNHAESYFEWKGR